MLPPGPCVDGCTRGCLLWCRRLFTPVPGWQLLPPASAMACAGSSCFSSAAAVLTFLEWCFLLWLKEPLWPSSCNTQVAPLMAVEPAAGNSRDPLWVPGRCRETIFTFARCISNHVPNAVRFWLPLLRRDAGLGLRGSQKSRPPPHERARQGKAHGLGASTVQGRGLGG